MKLEVSRQNFEEYSNMKCNENPSSGSRVVSCERTDRRVDLQIVGRTDMAKLRAAVLNSGNAPNNDRY